MAESCRGATGIQTKNFKVECSNVKTFCVCLADELVGIDLDGHYIEFFSSGNINPYYIWFDIDGAANDPVATGTGIPIVINGTDVGETIAEAVALAVNANADFCALHLERNKKCFVIKTIDYLTTSDPVSSDIAVLDPFVEHEGFRQNLGLTSGGGFDISFNVESNELKCDQTGSLIVAEEITGIKPEMEVVFKECNTKLLKKIFAEGIGNTCEINGVEYMGLGSASVGRNVLERANRITLFPVENAPNDYSNAITFMLAFPKLDSFSFPSEESSSITVTFTGYRDEFAKCAESDVLHLGDPRVL